MAINTLYPFGFKKDDRVTFINSEDTEQNGIVADWPSWYKTRTGHIIVEANDSNAESVQVELVRYRSSLIRNLFAQRLLGWMIALVALGDIVNYVIYCYFDRGFNLKQLFRSNAIALVGIVLVLAIHRGFHSWQAYQRRLVLNDVCAALRYKPQKQQKKTPRQ